MNNESTPALICVAPENLDAAWPIAGPYIRSGYEACDEFMPDNVLPWLKEQKGLLWLAIKDKRVIGAITTSLERKPSGLALRMMACASDDLEHCRACEQVLDAYARREGCVKVTAEGRCGWVRSILGYKTTRAFFEKVL